ncbi:MAG TPA: DPP IV N-terminal domain-containing protein, partial [Pyrinomonadaceae bacterium]
MKKIQWLAVAIFALASFVHAQDKMLSIDDIFDPQKRVNFSGRPTSVQWTKDGTTYKQVQNQMLMRVDALTGESREFFDNKKLVSVLTQTTGFSPEEANKLGTAPAQQFNNAETVILINHKNDLYLYNMAGGLIRRLTNTPAAEELEADFSPDDRMVSFVRGMNLFVVDVATGRETQLTRDGGEKILNGYLDWVYEEELYGRGQKRGYWWSPDSTHIAFLRTDETPVPKFVLPDDTVNDQKVENTDYPQAGDPNPLVKLGAVNVRTRAVRFADTSKYEPKDFLIARVTWSPDSQAMIYQAQNREQTFLDLNGANRVTGKTVTVFRETSPAWVEVIDNPLFLKDYSMIWQSTRSGFKHLYN